VSSSDDLIKSIRNGELDKVRALLNAGVPVDIDGSHGQPGLPIAMACFLGHVAIVKALVQHGAKVNLADNSISTSPLSMALRGNKRDVVRLLIELGVKVPESMQGSLNAEELALLRQREKLTPNVETRGRSGSSAIEEIDMVGCYGTDTGTLEADVMRMAREMAAKKKLR